MPALTVHNAEVKTAAVEIKTLTISGKQVTLAVFRQLKEELLVTEDGGLNGVPWGTVNYHPDKCGDSRLQHIHVVWQVGTELHRARVDKPEWWHKRVWTDDTDAWVQAVYCRNGHALPDWIRSGTNREDGGRCYQFRFDGVNCETTDTQLDRPTYNDDQHRCVGDEAAAQLDAAMRIGIAEEKGRRARINAQWSALNALPQLFIAV